MSLAKYANVFFFAFDVESTVREASAATGLGVAALRTAVSRERKRRIKTNFQPSLPEKQRVTERLKALRDMLPTAKLRRGTMPRGYEIRSFVAKKVCARTSRATIDIELYVFTHCGIASAIIEAFQRGVVVRVFTDFQKCSSPGCHLPELMRAGIPVLVF